MATVIRVLRGEVMSAWESKPGFAFLKFQAQQIQDLKLGVRRSEPLRCCNCSIQESAPLKFIILKQPLAVYCCRPCAQAHCGFDPASILTFRTEEMFPDVVIPWPALIYACQRRREIESSHFFSSIFLFAPQEQGQEEEKQERETQHEEEQPHTLLRPLSPD